MRERCTENFNVNLTPSDKRRLEELATRHDCSMGLILRNLIKYAHAMEIHQVPTCASGKQCPVPHVHAQTAPPYVPPSTAPALPGTNA